MVPVSEPTAVVRRGPCGKPILYPESADDERLERVLDGIRAGKVGFRAACEAEGWRPETVVLWAIRDTPQGFREAYREARRVEMEMYGHALVDIADQTGTTAGEVYQAQNRIKTRQWLMERRAAQDYGDKGVVDDSGKPVPKQQIKIGSVTIDF